MKRQTILVFTNILTLFLLIAISIYYNIPGKALIKMGLIKKKTAAVIKNSAPVSSHNEIRRSLFSEYQNSEYRVVMLGDSITERTAWNELLGISDIANRGIDSDTSEGFYTRLSDIYQIKPQLCFIMGGINDIFRGIAVNEIQENMKKIIDELVKNGIKPVMQSTLYVSRDFPHWEEINKTVDSLNAGLKRICAKKNIPFIDINNALSFNGALRAEYSCDGLHLSALGYKEWGKKISPLITESARGDVSLPNPLDAEIDGVF
jgi:lysophospholipase L1-like esterase